MQARVYATQMAGTQACLPLYGFKWCTKDQRWEKNGKTDVDHVRRLTSNKFKIELSQDRIVLDSFLPEEGK